MRTALLLTGLLLVGCGGTPTRKPPPAVVEMHRFSDVPLPPGYLPDRSEDQLAIGLAHGALRRMCMTFVRGPNFRGPGAKDLLAWQVAAYGRHGWELVQRDDDAGQACWRKARPGGIEELQVEIGSTGRNPTFRAIIQAAND